MKRVTVYFAGGEKTEYRFDGNVRISDTLTALSGFHMPCGGKGRCGLCKARVMGDVFPPDEWESRFLNEKELQNGIRLCCLAEAFGDCEVFLLQTGDIAVQIQGRMPDYLLNPLFDGEFGVAVDIGTTTLALALFSLKNGRPAAVEHAKNAQTFFGADVISRIGYSNENGVGPLRETIKEQLNNLLKESCRDAGIGCDQISGAVITGNTTMLHYLTGLDPEGIAHAPYKPRSLFGEFYCAADLGLCMDGRVYLPGAVSSYIGPDVVCGALACSLPDGGKRSLFIDIGTNGEMLLTDRGKILCCSAAAGPAFEGTGITCGMIALPGAIDRLESDGRTLRVSTIGGVKPAGICGTGLIDALAVMLEFGIIDYSGRIRLAGHPFVNLVSEDVRGRYVKIYGDDVIITQQDVRMLQLTKSAVAAGIEALLKEGGIDAFSLDEGIIAGGFGYNINFNNAEKIGLFPEGLIDRLSAAGNTALSGASLMLLSRNTAERAKKISESARELILSQNQFFRDRYIERMMF